MMDLAGIPDEGERIAQEIVSLAVSRDLAELRTDMVQRRLIQIFAGGDPDQTLRRSILAIAVMQNLATTVEVLSDELWAASAIINGVPE